jgi:hypothetical protein
MRLLRLSPHTATILGGCLAVCWAAIASLARAHSWIPSTFGEGVLTLVLSPLCASILLVQGGFRGWDRLGREPRVRVAGYFYLLSILIGVGLFLLSIVEFMISGYG